MSDDTDQLAVSVSPTHQTTSYLVKRGAGTGVLIGSDCAVRVEIKRGLTYLHVSAPASVRILRINHNGQVENTRIRSDGNFVDTGRLAG